MTYRPDKYDSYRRSLVAGGIPESEVDREIAIAKAEDAKIDACICPRCGARLARVEDPRQAGPTELAGKWFNYRCTRRCGWFADRCEPVGEN